MDCRDEGVCPLLHSSGYSWPRMETKVIERMMIGMGRQSLDATILRDSPSTVRIYYASLLPSDVKQPG